MRYPVVCFDVGFTLVKERFDVIELMTGLLAAQGHAAAPAALLAARQAADHWYHQRYFTLDNGDWSSDARIRALWLSYYERLFTTLDPALDHRLLAEQLIDHYETPANWEPYDDVLPTLDGLKRRQVRIGVVSDWSGALRPILHGLGLSSKIDFVVGSADSGFAKPMSELYGLAVARAGVAAERIIHVGDSYFGDVLGARAVGMDAALLDRAGRHQRMDCPVLRRLDELLELV